MATVLDTLQKGTAYLDKYGIEEARLNMEHLIAHVLKTGRLQLYLDFDRPLPETALQTLRDLTKRRSLGEPLQHLLGVVDFHDLTFLSDARALIPRPETEELTAQLLAHPWTGPLEVLDMGCGSGVIGLTLAAKLIPQGATVTLADVSADALDLAKENAQRLQLPVGQLRWVQSDLFTHIQGSFDLIVANLPYIPDSESTALSKEVLRDPALALYGGEQGTEIMVTFLSEAPRFTQSGGRIAMEFGYGQADLLRTRAEEAGFSDVEIRKDMSGNERFLFATKLD